MAALTLIAIGMVAIVAGAVVLAGLGGGLVAAGGCLMVVGWDLLPGGDL